MTKRDSKGVLTALKISYEGVGVYVQIACKCGMQTKKVLLGGKESAYDIWNGTVKKKK